MKIKCPKKYRSVKSCQGAMVVEFALIASIYFFITFAIFDAGRLIYNYNLVAHAVREGVRWAAVRGTTTEVEESAVSRNAIQGKVNEFSMDAVPVADIACDPEANSNCKTPGVIVKIKSTPDQVCSEKACPWTEAKAEPGTYVQIIAQMQFEPFIPLPSITLRDNATMQINR